VAYRDDVNVGAAGSICTSVADFSRWLRLQLNGGSLDGSQIVAAEIIAETHTAHTPMRISDAEKKLFPTRHFSAYGLGWFLNDIHGRLAIRHTGGVDGMLSSTVLIPEEKIGIAVFSNKLPNSAFSLLPHTLVDHLLGAAPRDWLQTYLDLDKEGKQAAQQAQMTREQVRAAGTQPSLPLEKYVGSYDSPVLGGAAVSLAEGGLHIQLAVNPSIRGSLSHWHYDTFLCKWDDPVLGESLVPFISDGQGQVREIRLRIREDWIDPLEHVFTKAG
jgi:CubicO group peptidase (beta-lactamase class C family)